MKRHLLLSLAAILLALPIQAYRFDRTYDDWTLTYAVIDENAKTVELACTDYDYRCLGNPIPGDLVLLSDINAGSYNAPSYYTLVSIGRESMTGLYGLTSVVIPNSVISIGDYACWGLSSLKSVTIGESVTSIGEHAFAGSVELTSLTLGNSVISIGKQAFYYCPKLTSLIIPESVVSIGANAFADNTGLTSLTFGNSVTSIGSYAFSNCPKLTSLIIPESVVSIGANAFADNTGLTSLTFGNSVTSIGSYAFSNCPKLTSLIIPESVSLIEYFAFGGCSSLTSITSLAIIPPSCTRCFDESTYSTAILYVPQEAVESYKCAEGWRNFDKIYAIGAEPFEVVIDGLKYILNQSDGTAKVTYAEYGNSNNYSDWQDVIVPETIEFEGEKYIVTTIGRDAFSYCSSLRSVELPNTITTIGDYAFYGASKLASINMPSSIESIGTRAFEGCGLTKAEFTSLEHMLSIDFQDDYANPLTVAHHLYIKGEEVTEIVIPGSITRINPHAFDKGTYITSVLIPNSVTSIGHEAFSHCYALTSIEIPNSVTDIEYEAFHYSGLTSIVLGSSVKNIGHGAFNAISNLLSVTSLATTPPTIENSLYKTFTSNTYSNGTLTVPQGAVNAYKAAYGWSNFKRIIVPPHEETIGGLRYIIKPADMTAVVTYAELNSLSNYEGLLIVIVPETVEYEGETYTVVGIGDEAFNNCWGLKAVSLPETLESIGKLAFGYCTSLRSVAIPDNVMVIDNEAFTGCSALASVTIGNSVETIGDYAFFGCTGLASLHVPESVKTIGENAFMGIHWINEVHAKAAVPAEAPVSAFSTNAYRNATLVVPNGALNNYKAHPTWSNFMTIRENGDVPTRIEVVDGAIVVKGAETVRVYNASGAQVYVGPAGRIELPSGIYLVSTDDVSKKVRI